MDGELWDAIHSGDLPRVKLLVEGGASIAVSLGCPSALMCAAINGRIQILEWLLTEGGATVLEINEDGHTAVLAAAAGWRRPLQTVQWLIEHGGGNIMDTSLRPTGDTVWDLLKSHLIDSDRDSDSDSDSDSDNEHDATAVTSLLRVMVLRQAPPARPSLQNACRLSTSWSCKKGRGSERGSQRTLSSGVPTSKRTALCLRRFGTWCTAMRSPPPPEELWATGIGVAPRRDKRPQPDGGDAPPLRRSARVRQRRDDK